MKKRTLSLLLCLCMALCLLPAAASAATAVTKITLTMTEPAAGKAPAKTATVPSTASTVVKRVDWVGEFDSKGNFKPGMEYTVQFTMAVKEGQDKVISLTYKSDITVNGHKITNGLVLGDGREATLQYTYTIPAGAADAAVPGELGYLSAGTGKIQNVSDGNVLSVYDFPDSTVRTKLGSVKNGDAVELLAAYVGGKGQMGSYHAIKYNGGVAYIPAYKTTDLCTRSYVAMTRDDGPIAASGAAFTKGDCGFATLDSIAGLDAYRRPAGPSGKDQVFVDKIQNGDRVFVLAVGVPADEGLIPYDAVLWKGQVCYVLSRSPETLWKDAAVLGKSTFKPPILLQDIPRLPNGFFTPKHGEAPLLTGAYLEVGKPSIYHTIAESITYDQEICQPYTWATATVKLKAEEGWIFKDQYTFAITTQYNVNYRKVSDTEAVLSFYHWVGAEGLETKPTQEMLEWWTLHQGDTANEGAPVATGQRIDPIVENLKGTSVTVRHEYAAKVWKYPTMADKANTTHGDATIDDVWETMRIYDLHAERLFPGQVVGQWYLVECDNKIGFVPAGYVKNVKRSNFWDGAPAAQKETEFIFAGGTGTKEDPYLVANADQLNAMRYGLDKHYKLIADIDLSAWGNWQPIGGTPAYGGMGNVANQKADKGQGAFTGTLNGNHHIISGMTIVDHRDVPWSFENYATRGYGLFSKVYGDSQGNFAFGYDNNTARTVWDLGMVNYTIDLSYTNVTKKLTLSVAPFFARGSNMCMDNCYSAGGTIKVNYGGTEPPIIEIGGLVGNMGVATIRNCYNTSDITVTTEPGYKMTNGDFILAAGIASGISSVWVHDCFNAGNITLPFAPWWRASSASGLVGDTYPPEFSLLYYYPENGRASVVKDCYNAGKLTATAVNGILDGGSTDVYVYRNYNAGKLVTGGDDPWADEIIAQGSLVITDNTGTHFVHDNGQASCTSASWQYSSKLGRKVLKSIPEDTLKIPEVKPTQPAIPAAGTAYTLQQTAVLDGKEVAFDTYALKDANGNGTNYMKIRDLAYVLNGSKGQFALGYDAGSISFKSKTPYVPNGTEMKVPFTGDQPYFVTPGTFLVDGVKKELTTISILDAAGNGYTYIKVRDLAQALNFYVGWNGKIVIDTGKPYEG